MKESGLTPLAAKSLTHMHTDFRAAILYVIPGGTSVPSTSMSTFTTSFPCPRGTTATSSPIFE